MWLEVLAVIMVLLLAGLVGMFVWRYVRSTHQDVNDRIKQVVDKYNASSEYTYRFDKQQQQNIQNMETNVNNMYNNYAYVKNEVLKLKGDAAMKRDLAKEVKTNKVLAENEVQLGGFKMVERAPKDVLARADGKNWLFLYHATSADAGLTTNKIDASRITANSAKVETDVEIVGNARIGKDWTIGEKWIMTAQDSGALSMAPKNNRGSWDWTKQVSMEPTGYVNASRGGVVTRGGSSVFNPDQLDTTFPSAKDNKNYIRGDTQLDGELRVNGPLQIGSVVEKKNSTNPSDRSGVGAFANGVTRVYTTGSVPGSSVNLSVAKSATAYEDVVTVKQDKRVDINGPLSMKERASASKELCVGNVCLREGSSGNLEACNSDLTQCKSFVMT